MNKIKIRTTDTNVGPIEFDAEALKLGFSRDGVGDLKITSLAIDFEAVPGSAALTRLMDSYRNANDFDSLVLDVYDDQDRLLQRYTLTAAKIARLAFSSDADEAYAQVDFVFENAVVGATTTTGASEPDATTSIGQDLSSFIPVPDTPERRLPPPGTSDGDYDYVLKADGKEIALFGYQLSMVQPFDSNGGRSGSAIVGQLLLHIDEEPGDPEIDWLLDLGFRNMPLSEARIEVRNADGLVIHSIALTGVDVQAQAAAGGAGGARNVVALAYQSMVFGTHSDPGSAQPDVSTQIAHTASDATTLAEIAALAQVPSGGSVTLSLLGNPPAAGEEAEKIVLKGLELDFAAQPNGTLSPLLVHFGGAPLGKDLIRLFDAFHRNADVGTGTDPVSAVFEYRDENGLLIKRLTVTDARVVAQSLAGGGGGGDAALALVYESIKLESAFVAGADPLNEVEFSGGGLAFGSAGYDLAALAAPPAGGGFKYKLVIDGMELAVAGYELDLSRAYQHDGTPFGPADYSPLLLHVRGGDEAEIVKLITAAHTNLLMENDPVLQIRNLADQLVATIKLTDAAVSAVAMAGGTGRSTSVVALSYTGIELEDIVANVTSVTTLGEGSLGPNGHMSTAEFAVITKSAQVRTGNSQTIELALQVTGGAGEEPIVLKLDGFELDLYRETTVGLTPLVAQLSADPGDARFVGLLDFLARNMNYASATITVKNGEDAVLQTILLNNARVVGQSLGAGGGGSDVAIALVYEGIELSGAGSEDSDASAGSPDASYDIDSARFSAFRPSLFGLARVEDGNDFSYALKFDSRTVEIAGYELDLVRPFDQNGAASGSASIRSLILHFDESAGNEHLIELMRLAGGNMPTGAGEIEVRDDDGKLVHKIVLTNFTVNGGALADATSDGEAVFAINYEKLDFQTWDPADPGATQPTHNVELLAGGGAPGLNMATVSLAELAAEANAGNPGWVDRLIGEVQDFFEFVRTDLPQRALGIVTPGSMMRGGDFSTLAAEDLPSLADVPIIGDKLLPYVENGLNIFRDVEARIIAALNELPDSEDAAQALADKINELGIAGLEAEADGTGVRVTFTAEDVVDFLLDDLKVSLGTDRFGLDLDADVAAKIKAALNMSIMVDVGTGAIEILDNAADELTLGLTAGADFQASAGLGFLDITATDNDPSPSEINLTFGLNLAGGRVQDIDLDDVGLSMDGSAKLNVHIITATPVSLLPTIAGDLVVSWSPSAPGEGLLREVAFNDVTLDLRSLLQTLAEIFEPITDIYDNYGIGTFLEAMTKPLPIIDTLARKVGVTSLLDFFPVEQGDGQLNLLDAFVLYLKANGAADNDSRIVTIQRFADALKAIDSMIGEGTDTSDLGLIELGSFSFVEPATSPFARGFGTLAADDTGIVTTEQKDPLQQINERITDSDTFGNVEGREGLSIFGASPFADGFNDITGFSMPILEDPLNAVKLLFSAAFPDEPITIMQYDLPAIEFAGEYSRFFPIVGPIGAVIGGIFEGRIDFAIGYDSEGLARGGLSDWEKGFYITTQEFLEGSNVFEPIATLKAGIVAGGAINVGVAAAGVIGGIIGEISAYLNDPDMDGKLRFIEFDECLVNPLTGKITAELTAFMKIGYGPFSWTRHFKIADATLADFAFGCDGPDASEISGLASLGPNDGITAGTLMLNVGNRAGERDTIPGYDEDVDEHYAIRRAVDANGALIPGALDVAAFTQIEAFGADPATPIHEIRGNFGADDDSLVIAQDVLTPSFIHGNGGNDLLSGGGGNDELHGDEGDDVLAGGGGNDTLFGGAGEDAFESGAGADYMDGGADEDQITYETSAAAVIFRAIAPVNGQAAFAGQGGDAEGDTLVSVEYIIGSQFSDRMYGNTSAPNTLEGLSGDDFLMGGNKADFILGGRGADAMFGLGDGGDGTSYLTSFGAVRIDLLTGHGYGGDAQGDYIVSIESVQGSPFDDVLRGTGARNVLDGFYGDDIIEGRGGADVVSGGGGDDTIYAIGDGDSIEGGSGRDLLSYVNRTSSGVSVNLRTGTGPGGDKILYDRDPRYSDLDKADSVPRIDEHSSIEDLDGTNIAASGDNLTGDLARNRIRGFAGNDALYGNGGWDTLVGGAGGDFLSGGDGRDLADYLDSTGTVGVSLELRIGLGAEANGDQFDQDANGITTVEDLRGGDFADILVGNEVNNRLDPSLSRKSGQSPDEVRGRGGIDTLVVDYSRGDQGEGMVGGYSLGLAFEGNFVRQSFASRLHIDRVNFAEIERLYVIGTYGDDIVYGGGGDDTIITESGDDLIYGGGKGVYGIEGPYRYGTAVGADRILAGAGDDTVFYGTNENRQLARDIISENFDGTFAPFYLDGGGGIDTLSISLVHFGQDIVMTGSPDGSEAIVRNFSLGGSYIANFEILGSVFTNAGFDQLTQTGEYNNAFETGSGMDVITPGLGTDTVDGGIDFSSNFDGGLTIDFANVWGDLLVLDYSELVSEGGVYGTVGSANSPLNTGQDLRFSGFRMNTGTYFYERGKVDFRDIERLDVTGSERGDTIVGTNNLTQFYIGFPGVGGFESADSSETLRGADILRGLGGGDHIVGNNGNDDIDGGEGNDLLVGVNEDHAFTLSGGRAYTDHNIDQTEVDTLAGGGGADVFVLGTTEGFYYGYTRSGSRTEEGVIVGDQNRAIITDFNEAEGDLLQLFGDSSLYSTKITADGVNLYVNERNGGRQWIAELQGLDGLDLNGSGIVYANAGGRAAAPIAAPEEPVQSAALTGDLAKSGPVALAESDWITQDSNPNSLRAKLLTAITGSAIDASTLTVALNGHGEAFGTFQGDPFGLGTGLILSTGRVEDLQGANTEDGRRGLEQSASLDFVPIGRSELTNFYRADLSDLGFDLNSITLPDSNSRQFGSGGWFSGFDVDSIYLSRMRIEDFEDDEINFDNPNHFIALDVFDFTAGGTLLTPGTMNPRDIDQPGAGGEDLVGTRNGIILDPSHFALTDGASSTTLGATGVTSLGDGGSLSINLKTPLAGDGPLYLYVGEYGGAGETITSQLTASSKRVEPVSDLSTDFGEVGTEHDTSSMTFSFDRLAGSADDTILFSFVMFTEELAEFAGSQFNDIVKITLNGENLAELSDGAALTVNNLLAAPMGPYHPDLVLNPVGTGPLASQVKADAYTKTLNFAGALKDHNVITIEVKDIGDGGLDTGVLVRAGTAATGGGWTTTMFNDAPVFSNLDGAATYAGGSAPVLMDGSAQVFDVELAASGNYAGATLTLSRLTGADARDMFGASGQVSFSGGNLLYSGAPQPIGTVQMAAGVLTLSFNANATQAAVNAVLSSLTYSSTAATTESIDILWEFSDGNSGAQGLGGPLKALGATSIDVRGVNLAPTANADALAVNEDATLANLVGVLLGNDTDPNLGDTLRIASVNATGTLGTLVFNESTQSLSYTADHPSFDALEPGEFATTTFTYTVRDAGGQTSTATVSIRVDGLLNDDDYIYGTPQNDTMNGSAANEKFRALAANDIVYGEGGNDRIEGGDGNDILYGGTGANLLFGEGGNDTFGNETVTAANRYDGGDGSDTLITRSAGAAVAVDLVAGTVTGGYNDGSIVIDIENLKNGSTNTAVAYTGNDAANALTGGLLADILRGGGGSDTLQGSAGDDLIDGGSGADMLGGGAGNDIFVLRRGETHGDRLLDFIGNGAGVGDMLQLEGFGPDARLIVAGTTFTIQYTGGTETFTMNTPLLHATDYVFV